MTDKPPRWPTIEVPKGIQLDGPDFDEDARMLVVLGALVRAASAADRTLRTLYCALIGSPYAVVTAAGKMTSQLISDCKSLVGVRTDLSRENADKILALLSDLKRLSEQRNRFVHDVWTGGRESHVELMRSKPGTNELTFRPITLDELIATEIGIRHTSVQISHWIFLALPDEVSMEAQLRIESQTLQRASQENDE